MAQVKKRKATTNKPPQRNSEKPAAPAEAGDSSKTDETRPEKRLGLGMAAPQNNFAAKPASCRQCPEWQEMRRKLRISELLLQAIDGFENRLKAKSFKPTVTEYLKLLQMEQEIDAQEEGPKEIKVTWVDPTVASDSEK